MASIKKQVRCFSTALLWAVSVARAQEAGPLEQQLEELKQQYADTARELERRIAAPERQIAEQKTASSNTAGPEAETAKSPDGTISVGELATRELANVFLGESDQVGAKFQGSDPKRLLMTS